MIVTDYQFISVILGIMDNAALGSGGVITFIHQVQKNHILKNGNLF